ncbi:LuxR C-terminal-related transcriptional regulator [Mammaliicoccus sp. D-M17]|uniref:LuxR C-terminal-related transcriptional regulator n=1 Tax=Mammaliicoccus sp. D-M17 TaxID=2898677 RepID=UPI001EFAB7D9|nr:LuxR C-terminal-related transcriptional regulator [Mammaliicoccus sp. D-M17]
MKTVKEIAEELGVTKQTIHNHLKNLPSNLTVNRDSRVIRIDTDVEAYLKKIVSKNDVNLSSNNDKLIDMYKEQIASQKETISDLKKDNEYLREQMKSYTQSIAKTQELLDQQQKLALLSQQKLEQVETEKRVLIERTEENKEEKKGFWANFFNK